MYDISDGDSSESLAYENKPRNMNEDVQLLQRTSRLDEFINLFLASGQRNFLYENTPWARRPSALTVSKLSPSYIAVAPDLPLEAWQFISGAPALCARDVN